MTPEQQRPEAYRAQRQRALVLEDLFLEAGWTISESVHELPNLELTDSNFVFTARRSRHIAWIFVHSNGKISTIPRSNIEAQQAKADKVIRAAGLGEYLR
jgi:hypothetical protein